MLDELQNQEIIARNDRRSWFATTALCAAGTFSSIPIALNSDASPWLVAIFATACVLGAKFGSDQTANTNDQLQEIRRQIYEHQFLLRLNQPR